MCGGFECQVGTHAYSLDGVAWHYGGTAYTNRINFTDGSFLYANRRERPHVLFKVAFTLGTAVTMACLSVCMYVYLCTGGDPDSGGTEQLNGTRRAQRLWGRGPQHHPRPGLDPGVRRLCPTATVEYWVRGARRGDEVGAGGGVDGPWGGRQRAAAKYPAGMGGELVVELTWSMHMLAPGGV
jgi:hypothetical protein